MKKIIILLIAIAMLFTSCADSRTLLYNDKKVTFEPKGLVNADDMNPDVHYEVSAGNVVLGIIFSETIVVPVVIAGWYLWEPIELKEDHVIGE